jgi:hypothetical protein
MSSVANYKEAASYIAGMRLGAYIRQEFLLYSISQKREGIMRSLDI